MTSLTRRRAFVFGASVMLVAGAIGVGRLATQGESGKYDLPRAAEEFLGETGEKDLQEGSQGVANGGSGGEAAEQQTAMEQFAEARTAPGIVNAGSYSSAFNHMTGLDATAGTCGARSPTSPMTLTTPTTATTTPTRAVAPAS